MADQNKPKEPEQEGTPRRWGGLGSWIALLIVGGLATVLVYQVVQQMSPSQISWSYFEQLIDGRDFEGRALHDAAGSELSTNIEKITWAGEEAIGIFKVIPPA
jgi:hypothetical protein